MWVPLIIVVGTTVAVARLKGVECPVPTRTLTLEALSDAEVALLKGTLKLGTTVGVLILEIV